MRGHDRQQQRQDQHDHQPVDAERALERERHQKYGARSVTISYRAPQTWAHHKEESITGYRDRSFSSPCTGTVGPVHHTPWWDEPDDSLATFLRTEGGR